MLFSVLVAHYNNFEFFKDFYESVLSQSYKNLEIIIVDDHSTDDSFLKLKNLTAADARVKTFQNDRNMGVGFTKRKCVAFATGEICGFVDPDDAITPDAIERSVQKYDGNPEIVGTYSQIMLCDNLLSPQKIFSKTRKIVNGNPLFFNINNEVSHFFTFRKKAYLKTSGINEKLTASEDFDLYLKIYEIGDLAYIPAPLYLYRLHEKGISQNTSQKEKVHENWNKMLLETCKRRKISKIGKVKIAENMNLAALIFQRENTLPSRILRRFKKFINR